MNLRATGVSLLITATVSVAMSSAAWAQTPVSYTSGGAVVTGVGDQIPGSPYDVLTLGASAGTMTSSGAYTLGPVSFTAGLNSFSDSPYTVTGDMVDELTVGGIAKSVTIDYTATINALSSCSFFGCVYGDKITLDNTVVSYSPYLTLDILATTLSSYGATSSTALTADVTRLTTVTAPELSAGSLFSGLSLLFGGLVVLRGRRSIEAQPV